MFAEHGNTSSQNQDVSLCFSLGIDGSSRREKDEMCQHGTSYQSKSTLDQSEPSEPSLSGQVDPDRQKSMPTYPFGLHSTCGIEAWCGNTWAVPSGESLTNTHQVCLPYDLHLSRLQRLSLTAYNALGNPPESMLHIYQNLHGLLGPLILHWFLLFSIIHLQCQNISPWIFGKTCFCPLVLQKSWQKNYQLSLSSLSLSLIDHWNGTPKDSPRDDPVLRCFIQTSAPSDEIGRSDTCWIQDWYRVVTTVY